MSSYTGLCVTKTESGRVVGVQVIDTAGNEINISPETYVEREVRPLIDELPSCSERRP